MPDNGKTRKGRVVISAATKAKHKAEILVRIAEGEPLMQICRDLKIAWRTAYLWKDNDPVFDSAFAHAREVGFDAIAEKTMEIADETPVFDPFGKVDNGHVNHRKLRIETRLKLLAKWSPKKYGERLNLDGNLDVNNMTEEQLKAELGKLLSAGVISMDDLTKGGK